MEQFLSRPASFLLDHYGLGLQDLMLLDEPPMMLSSFAFQQKDASKQRWFRVLLPLTKELFSKDRVWSLECVRAATVIAIHEGNNPLCIPAARVFKKGESDKSTENA